MEFFILVSMWLSAARDCTLSFCAPKLYSSNHWLARDTPSGGTSTPPSFEATFAGSDRRRFPDLCRATSLLRLPPVCGPFSLASYIIRNSWCQKWDKFLFISRTQRRLPHPFCLLIAGRQIQSGPSYAELLIVKYPFLASEVGS
ncbi:Hypothetical predicted protein [Cloeon dipterum]|uniref:Secreted protein n=1 Tax=Cloeon dipterum TaxID=197152 RepID=A0A8S1DPM0_9INSE|nr:Hypothetical predicted protein [Cloeon dipterum]